MRLDRITTAEQAADALDLPLDTQAREFDEIAHRYEAWSQDAHYTANHCEGAEWAHRASIARLGARLRRERKEEVPT